MRKIGKLNVSLKDDYPGDRGNWLELSSRLRSLFAKNPNTDPNKIVHAPLPGPIARFLKVRRRPTGLKRQFAAGQLPMGLAVALCFGFYGLVGAYGLSISTNDDIDLTGSLADVSQLTGLEIKDIQIDGLTNEFRRGEVIAALGVDYEEPILRVSTEAARQRIQNLPWIAEADVQRLFPGTLIISIRERVPFAVWQNRGQITVIDIEGQVISEFAEDAVSSLPLVVGEGANGDASEILATLAGRPEIRTRMRAIVRVGERRWNVRLNNGIDIRLPEKNIEAALDQLVALDTIHGLFNRDISAIDLRIHDRISIRLANDSDALTPEQTGGAT